MIVALFILMAFAAAVQPTIQRKVITGAYVSAVMISDLLTVDVSGQYYYLLSGVAALLFMGVVVWCKEAWIAVGLAQVCLMSIFANLIGWLIWENNLNQGIYESIFTMIYLYAIYVMMRVEKNGDNKNNLNRLWFRTAFDDSLQYIFKSFNKA